MGNIKPHPLYLEEAAWSPEWWIFTFFKCNLPNKKSVKIHPESDHDSSYTQRE